MYIYTYVYIYIYIYIHTYGWAQLTRFPIAMHMTPTLRNIQTDAADLCKGLGTNNATRPY